MGQKKFLQRLDGHSKVDRNELALVFSGGGAKGAYEVGVWKALREAGIDRQVGGISGSSIGALNALFFALGDYESAEELWLSLSDSEFRKNTKQQMSKMYDNIDKESLGYTLLKVLSRDMFISQKTLEHTVGKIVSGNMERLQKYHIFSTATPKENWLKVQILPPDRRPEPDYISWDNLKAADIALAIMASSAMPLIYDPVTFQGKLYCDGGISDNTPVKPLYGCGYKRFLIVYLDHANSPLVKATLDKIKPFDIQAIHVIPNEQFKADFAAMVTLSPELTKKRMQHGYEDMLRKLEQII